jgi:hypothetical protein
MNKVIYDKLTGRVVNVLAVSMQEVTHYFAKETLFDENGEKHYGEEKEIKDYQLGNYDQETIREEKRLEEFPKLYFNTETCAVADTYENPTYNNKTHYLVYKDGVFSTKPIFTYEQLVEKYIRERYSVSQELAILRQRLEKPEEFNDYYSYAEGCKARAKVELGIV